MLTIEAREGATPPVAVQSLLQYGRSASIDVSIELIVNGRVKMYLRR
jgi:hypothetical protein